MYTPVGGRSNTYTKVLLVLGASRPRSLTAVKQADGPFSAAGTREIALRQIQRSFK